MYLTSPPITTVGLHVTLSASPGSKYVRKGKTNLWRVASVRDLERVKIGMLEGVARRVMEGVVRHALMMETYASVESIASVTFVVGDDPEGGDTDSGN